MTESWRLESLFHGYINPYGLGLMSLSSISMEMSWEFTVDPSCISDIHLGIKVGIDTSDASHVLVLVVTFPKFRSS